MGGSDHRPITFNIDIGTLPPSPKKFSKWGIRKFEDPIIAEKFNLTLNFTRCQLSTEVHKLGDINKIWELILLWIRFAAKDSCGTKKFKITSNSKFWTKELRDQNKLIDIQK